MRTKIFYKRASLVLYLPFLFCLSAYSPLYAQKKKKLYISTIQTKDIPGVTSDIVYDRLKLSILENFGNDYYILNDLDIQMMNKGNFKIFDSGCEPEACLKRIGDSIEVDEIIYGEMQKEKKKIRAIITNFTRDVAKARISTKSVVNLAFREAMYEYYIQEIAIKLMNPQHSIKQNPEIRSESYLEFGFAYIEIPENLDSSIFHIHCKMGEDDLQNHIRNGDEKFHGKEYSSAIKNYEKALKKLKSPMEKEECSNIQSFKELTVKRIIISYQADLGNKLEVVDNQVKANTTIEYKKIEEYIKRYNSVLDTIAEQYNTDLAPLKQSILDRIDNLWLLLSSTHEKKGDIAYKEYRFETTYKKGFFYRLQFWKDNIESVGALQQYENALNAVIKVQNKAKADTIRDDLLKKIEKTKKTGENYLSNTVFSLLNQAKYLYTHQKDVSTTMEKAKELILNSTFTTEKIIENYNEQARWMGRKTIDKNSIKQSNLASSKILL
ncbi:MAG: hypothetical protein H7A23_17050 [Leptospiraceae bacterium]|nr:hypothetical protein [Leptospiraceae bacterium]MCP5496255.1 hypothetical protein [Leptospiraceae bacterium]